MTGEIHRYRHLPTEVTAIQWDSTEECLEKIKKMDRCHFYSFTMSETVTYNKDLYFYEKSKYPRAHDGDYIVRDEGGGMWTVGRFEFDKIYERMEEEFPLTFMEAIQKLLDGKKVTNEYAESAYANSYYKMDDDGSLVYFRVDFYRSADKTYSGLALDEVSGRWKVVE